MQIGKLVILHQGKEADLVIYAKVIGLKFVHANFDGMKRTAFEYIFVFVNTLT